MMTNLVIYENCTADNRYCLRYLLKTMNYLTPAAFNYLSPHKIRTMQRRTDGLALGLAYYQANAAVCKSIQNQAQIYLVSLLCMPCVKYFLTHWMKVNVELEKSPLAISENKIMKYLKSSFLSALHRSPNVYVKYIHF